MRLFIFILPALLILACQGNKQPHHQEAIIKHVLESQVDAWNRGDIDGFMQGYWNSPQLRFISKNGMKRGYQTVAESYKKHYNSKEKMGRLEFSNLSFTTLSEKDPLVNVCGNWLISGTDSSGGFFSLLLKRIDQEWKITVDHTW